MKWNTFWVLTEKKKSHQQYFQGLTKAVQTRSLLFLSPMCSLYVIWLFTNYFKKYLDFTPVQDTQTQNKNLCIYSVWFHFCQHGVWSAGGLAAAALSHRVHRHTCWVSHVLSFRFVCTNDDKEMEKKYCNCSSSNVKKTRRNRMSAVPCSGVEVKQTIVPRNMHYLSSWSGQIIDI